MSLPNSDGCELAYRDRKGEERGAEEWRDEEQKKGEAIFRQLHVYRCQRKEGEGGYFGVLSEASDKLPLQY